MLLWNAIVRNLLVIQHHHIQIKNIVFPDPFQIPTIFARWKFVWFWVMIFSLNESWKDLKFIWQSSILGIVLVCAVSCPNHMCISNSSLLKMYMPTYSKKKKKKKKWQMTKSKENTNRHNSVTAWSRAFRFCIKSSCINVILWWEKWKKIKNLESQPVWICRTFN